MSLSLKTLAFASLFTTLASLVTLAVVVTVKDVDALSTLALALAVLAFVVQLIVFIVQAADASRQESRNHELHASMMVVLSQIQERTQGTQQSIDRMNTTMLEALIGKAASEQGSTLDEDVVRRVATMLGDRPERSTSELTVPQTPERPHRSPSEQYPPLPRTVARKLHEEMNTWPSKAEIVDGLTRLEGLRPRDLAMLRLYAEDLRENTRPGVISIGPGLTIGSTMSPSEFYEVRQDAPNLEILSKRGRTVGRLLTAEGDPPVHRERLAAIREKASGLTRVGRAGSEPKD